MGNPTSEAHASVLSAKLLQMFMESSNLIIAQNNAQGPVDGCSAKRRRTGARLGQQLLLELSEDLDVDDERSKVLMLALVKHVRLKRHPTSPSLQTPTAFMRSRYYDANANVGPYRSYLSTVSVTPESATRDNSSPAHMRPIAPLPRWNRAVSSHPPSTGSHPVPHFRPDPSVSSSTVVAATTTSATEGGDGATAEDSNTSSRGGAGFSGIEHFNIPAEALERYRRFRTEMMASSGGADASGAVSAGLRAILHAVGDGGPDEDEGIEVVNSDDGDMSGLTWEEMLPIRARVPSYRNLLSSRGTLSTTTPSTSTLPNAVTLSWRPRVIHAMAPPRDEGGTTMTGRTSQQQTQTQSRASGE